MNLHSQIIIGVTGKWTNRTELIQQIAKNSGGYLLGGSILHHSDKNKSFEVEVYDHDTLLKESYHYAGYGRFNKSFLEQIDEHTYTIYIFSNGVGINETKDIVEAANGILHGGGIGLKVESTGIAFSKEEWQELSDNPDNLNIYSHFVTLVVENDIYYSVGMHSFGLPDIALSTESGGQVAARLMNEFNFYNLNESPVLNQGETFSISLDEPYYKMIFHEDNRYNSEELFHNPFGIWELQQIKNP